MDKTQTKGCVAKAVEKAEQAASTAKAAAIQTAVQVHQDELVAKFSESLSELFNVEQVVR